MACPHGASYTEAKQSPTRVYRDSVILYSFCPPYVSGDHLQGGADDDCGEDAFILEDDREALYRGVGDQDEEDDDHTEEAEVQNV